MKDDDLIKYRISRARETFQEAELLADNNHWNAAINRLYYACFYIVNALLIANKLNFNSHNGVKREFHKSFVKTKIVSIESGKLYSRLFNLRQEGDYIDFKRFEKEDVEHYIDGVSTFIYEIEQVILS